MEFKLNKIDTDVRKKMQEEIKDDKVHSGKNISVKKDLKDEKNGAHNEKQILTNRENRKKYITIDGVLKNNQEINVNAERFEDINELNSKGRVLDTKE